MTEMQIEAKRILEYADEVGHEGVALERMAESFHRKWGIQWWKVAR